MSEARRSSDDYGQEGEEGETKEEEYDIYRDSLLRYLGYANEVGESFRPILPRFVVPSYLVSFGYVGMDTLDKTRKELEINNGRYDLAANKAFDTMLWQTLASVIIPGFTINRVVKGVKYGIRKSGAGSVPALARWGPTAVGLAIIPFIVHPIDELVHNIMDKTTRPLGKKFLDSSPS